MLDKLKTNNIYNDDIDEEYIDEDYFYNQYMNNQQNNEIKQGDNDYLNNTLAYRYDEILL